MESGQSSLPNGHTGNMRRRNDLAHGIRYGKQKLRSKIGRDFGSRGLMD